MQNITAQKTPTLATVKAWLRKNTKSFQVKETSRFDGMVDMVTSHENPEWVEINNLQINLKEKGTMELNLIPGVWFVGGGRDWICNYNKDGYTGFAVNNCCGSFIMAVKNT